MDVDHKVMRTFYHDANMTRLQKMLRRTSRA